METKVKIDNNGSGYQVKSIILVESNLSREPNFNFDNLKLDVAIGTGVGVKDNIVSVELRVNVKQMQNDTPLSELSATMVGTFEKTGESPLNDMEEFGRINGASIIFPFLREHIANLAMKAGLGPIMLPPVNFQKLNKKKQ